MITLHDDQWKDARLVGQWKQERRAAIERSWKKNTRLNFCAFCCRVSPWQWLPISQHSRASSKPLSSRNTRARACSIVPTEPRGALGRRERIGKAQGPKLTACPIGMHAKAETGVYPSRAPIGYKNEKATRTVIVDSTKAEVVKRIFETYASGNVSLLELRKRIRSEFGIVVNRSYLHRILRNTFYIGYFVWGGKTYKGTHETFISPALFESVQSVLKGHNKPKYRKNDIAFRGLLTGAHDNCAVTAKLKKGKYVYYRCTGYRGKCDLPRFTEGEISSRLASVFENIRIPDQVLGRIQKSLQPSQSRLQGERIALRSRYEQRLSVIRKRMSQAYADKLDGKIDEEFRTLPDE